MKTIEQLFKVHRARSDLFSDYEPGTVAYVGNSLTDNAVVGYVTPRPGDLLFRVRSIVISAFCEASVQPPPFIACGRAGNGLVVLEPRQETTAGALAYTAAYINQAVRWRFNWYRQVTADRLRPIMVPDVFPENASFPVAGALPTTTPRTRQDWKLQLRAFALADIFNLEPGDYHNLSVLDPGDIPVVSCGDLENGIAGFYDVREHLRANQLTIALNGSTLTAKFHPYTFAAKDDVAVCTPREPRRVTTLLFVQAVLGMERWRYSYYRKCYLNKLARFAVTLPECNGELDEDTMESVVATAPYWDYLATRVA